MPVQSREELIAKKAFFFLKSFFYSEEVRISHPSGDLGIDLLIEIPKDRHWPLGVQVKEYLDMPSPLERNRVASAESRRHNLDKVPFPLVLCVVEVRATRGFYTWILEPVVEQKHPRLKQPDEYEWDLINVKTVHEMYVKASRYWEALVHHVRE